MLKKDTFGIQSKIEISVCEKKGLKRLEYMKKFWTGFIVVLVLLLNFESFFSDLLASVDLGNKNGCKGQH